ncbi:molybdate ABC transporter substrate-binding protein [Kordiimonas sp.]|uniref:molybdate ABC transporter substrate-binding protein n=1 Tax=Kordiimonas sp. TaxID=1970157 RepID=UPI003A9453D3
MWLYSLRGCFFALALLVLPSASLASEARVAVAANFTEAARALAAAYEQASDDQVALSFGSTGLLYAQITQGAPFDAFLAADKTRPARAVADGFGVAGTGFTYATGRLVLFTLQDDLELGADALTGAGVSRVAIANPATAPYGAAAIETLTAFSVLDEVAPKLVRGTNVAQAYQFVFSGSAEVGFVALSQVVGRSGGAWWPVPGRFHQPIAQDAVLLTRGADNKAAIGFLDFLKTDRAREIIAAHGYALP